MKQDTVKLTKKITLELNVLTGDVTLDNPDELNNLELLGLLECCKAMIYNDIPEY